MAIKDEIKSIIYKEGMTINSVASEMSIKPNSLSQKLARDTLRYSEAKAIAKILGYELEFKKH